MYTKAILELDKYIRELLYDYDCVIVPQLGGFVTNYRPASFSDKSGVATPPGKAILFNKNLTHSDGLLERTVSQHQHISFEEAGTALRKITEAYWSRLNGGEKVHFKRIGVLYIDAHKKLQFEPTEDENFLKSSFGFEPFSLPPMVKHDARIHSLPGEPEIIEMDTEDEDEALPMRKSRSIYWVAAAAILPFLGMSLYIGLSTNFTSPTEWSLAELVPTKSAVYDQAQYHPDRKRPELPETVFGKDDTTFPEHTAVFPFSLTDGAADSSGIWVNLNTVEAPATAVDRGPYHIITGCFEESKNAEKYVSGLLSRGFSSASILDYHRGLHRVEIENFGNYQEALARLHTFRDNGTFPNAWLLKKPKS